MVEDLCSGEVRVRLTELRDQSKECYNCINVVNCINVINVAIAIVMY